MRFWLLDVASEVENGRPFIWLWCKDESLSTWVVKQRYTPSFYLIGRIEAAAQKLKSSGVRFERCSKKVRGKPIQALKVYVDAEDLEKAASRLLRGLNGVEAYEEDLRSSIKYLLESGLRPCGWIEVEGENVQKLNGISFVKPKSIKRLEHAPPPNLTAVAIDPIFFAEYGSPTPDRDPVRLISLYFSDGFRVQLEGEEREIFEKLIKIIRERDPDVVVGFGLNKAQWNYLCERAERLGMRLAVGRLGSEPRTSVYGHVSIRGRLNIDLEDMARDVPELTVETLEEFVNYLGIKKEFDSVDEYELAERWRSDKDLVKRYSMQRAEAIMDAYEAVKDFIFSLSELTGMPADRNNNIIRKAVVIDRFIRPLGRLLTNGVKHPIDLVQVDVRRQWAERASLRNPDSARGSNDLFDQSEHLSILNTFGNETQKLGMLDRIEILRQIHIHHVRHPPHHTPPDFGQCTMRGPSGAISIRIMTKVGLEDGFEDQLDSALHHAVADAGNLKRPDLAVFLGNIHPAVLLGGIRASDQLLPDILEKSFSARGFDGLKCDAVDPRCAAVPHGQPVGLMKRFHLRDMHKDSPKPMRLVGLRLTVYPPPQILQTYGRLCHSVPASPWGRE